MPIEEKNTKPDASQIKKEFTPKPQVKKEVIPKPAPKPQPKPEPKVKAEPDPVAELKPNDFGRGRVDVIIKTRLERNVMNMASSVSSFTPSLGVAKSRSAIHAALDRAIDELIKDS